MRSSCGYGYMGIHRRLRNSRRPLSPTQLAALFPASLSLTQLTSPQVAGSTQPWPIVAAQLQTDAICETCQPISEARCCASRQADTRSRFHARSCCQATLVSDSISIHPSSQSRFPTPSLWVTLALALSVPLHVCLALHFHSAHPHAGQRKPPSPSLRARLQQSRGQGRRRGIGRGAGVCYGMVR